MNPIELTKRLIKFNTINPPGKEYQIALFLGKFLKRHDFHVEYLEFEKERLQIVAEKNIKQGVAPIVLSGHLDVVPLGNKEWTKKPFDPIIVDDKIYGRGSSDMKSGVAAIVSAAINVFNKGDLSIGVRLILTASEENGCKGANRIKSDNIDIGNACGLIIAEPTSNIPCIGHRGSLYLNAHTAGITAHASMPHEGENAIYKAARAIVKLENLKFNVENDPLLGMPSLNVGTINGGINSNSVPDSAGFTIDIRTTRELDNKKALDLVQKTVGDDVILKSFTDMNFCYTNDNEDFVKVVYEVCENEEISFNAPISLPYLTDASILQPLYNNVPTVIVGPGEPEMAHKTDEYCYVQKIEQAVRIYENIILLWNKKYANKN